MKNKKGFTLVELLIIVVIMVGILGIAMVSINKISTKQKQKAKQRVEEQIIVAAKSYFKDNEYFLRSIALSEEEAGYISLGTLVKLDYINAVIDPTTNQKMDPCSYVKVTTNGYEFKGSKEDIEALKNDIKEKNPEGECDMSEPKIGIITPAQPNPPDEEPPEEETSENIVFDVELYSNSSNTSCTQGTLKEKHTFNNKNKNLTSSWFNSTSNVSNGLYIKINPKEVPSDTKIYFYEITEEITNKVIASSLPDDTNTYCIKDDGIYNIKIKNTYNSEEYIMKVRLDRIPPKLILGDVTGSWTKAAEVSLDITITDAVSMVKSKRRYWNKSGLTKAKADSSTYKWNLDSLKYPSGDSNSKSGINASTFKEHVVYSSQGYRKGIVKACDYARNCDFSKEFIIKIDRDAPNVAKVTSRNTEWTNDDVVYDVEMEDKLSGVKYYIKETNKTNLTSSQSKSDTYKWNKSTKKYPQGYTSVLTNNDKGYGNSYKTTGSFNKKNQGRRLIRIVVCDYSENCTVSSATVAMIDTEPPEVIEAGSGYVHCLKAGKTDSYNAHGYSIKFKDNLSGASAKVYEYFSSWDCGSTDEFHWADSTAKGYTTSENNQGTYTTFVGCTNNPSPALRYSITDAAGNRYKNGSGKYYYGLSHSMGSISSSNKKECDSSVWYNKSPNK